LERDSGNRTHYSLSIGHTSGFADQEGRQPLAPHSGIAVMVYNSMHGTFIMYTLHETVMTIRICRKTISGLRPHLYGRIFRPVLMSPAHYFDI
jgi:hypothetical protein